MKTIKFIAMSIAGLIVLFLVILASTSLLGDSATASSSSGASTNSVQGADVGVQTVTVKVAGSSYVMEPSVLKKGIPVRMIADMKTFQGCSKAVTIPSFNVLKYVSQGDNVIEFTPTQTGTFKIACSMNMYRGTFTVVDENAGTAEVQAAQQAVQVAQQQESLKQTSGGSCGAGSGSGGCGCGMMG